MSKMRKRIKRRSEVLPELWSKDSGSCAEGGSTGFTARDHGARNAPARSTAAGNVTAFKLAGTAAGRTLPDGTAGNRSERSGKSILTVLTAVCLLLAVVITAGSFVYTNIVKGPMDQIILETTEAEEIQDTQAEETTAQ